MIQAESMVTMPCRSCRADLCFMYERLYLAGPSLWHAGEYLQGYDPAADLARLRSVQLNDYRTRRRLEQDWQRALKEALAGEVQGSQS